MDNTKKSYLKLGRHAIGNAERYSHQYRVNRNVLADRLRNNANDDTTDMLADAIFGNGALLYAADFMTSLQLLRLCDTIDDVVARLGDKTIEDDVPESEELQNLCLLSYNAVFLIEETGVFTPRKDNLHYAFTFDADRVRKLLLADAKDWRVRFYLGWRYCRVIKRLAKEGSDEEMVSKMKSHTEEFVKLFAEAFNQSDIRYVKNETEEYLRANYADELPEALLIKAYDIVDDATGTLAFYMTDIEDKSRDIPEGAYDGKICSAGFALINKEDDRLYASLAAYANTQTGATDSTRSFVAERLVDLMALHQNTDEFTRASDYRARINGLIDKVKKKVASEEIPRIDTAEFLSKMYSAS